MTPLDRNKLVTDNYGLIRLAARRACRKSRGLEFDDAFGELSLLVLRKADTYDPGRGSLSTWVFLLAARVAHSHRAYVRAACRNPGRELPAVEVAAPADPDPIDVDMTAVRSAIRRLPVKQRTAVVRRYGLDGRGERQLTAMDPSVSGEANRQRLHRGLAMLRTELAGRVCID